MTRKLTLYYQFHNLVPQKATYKFNLKINLYTAMNGFVLPYYANLNFYMITNMLCKLKTLNTCIILDSIKTTLSLSQN